MDRIKTGLTKMLPVQRELDNHILDKFPELKDEDLFDKRVLSLQIELGELANELPEVFKYWSHKKNNYANALEEYVDCLHFILSLGNKIKFTNVVMSPSKTNDMVASFIGLQGIIVAVKHAYHLGHTPDTHEQYQQLLDEFIRLGELIGFSWDNIEHAYFDKNKENCRRQANGY